MPIRTPRLTPTSVVTADGVRLSVLVAGPDPDWSADADGAAGVAAGGGLVAALPELPPVLAVHGFGSSAQFSWQVTGHLATLARAGRTVIAPDLRGHGLSDRPHRAAAYGYPTLLADLVAVRDAAVGPGRPVDLLGYSLGSRLCWSLATDPLVAARRVVLGGYDGRPLFDGVDPARLIDLLDRPAGDPALAAERIAVTTRGAGVDQTTRIAAIAHAVPGNDHQALAALVGQLMGTVPPEPDPQQPTLLVAGTEDPLADGAALLADALPDGAFEPVPGRDHISTVPAGVFRRAAAEFLGRP